MRREAVGVRAIPPVVDSGQLSSFIATHLGGRPVVWSDRGDEVLVHVESTRTKVVGGSLLVSIDLESDQTGRQPLVVVFACGANDDPAGLYCVTDELPHGNPVLAARWGRAVQDAIWSALLALATQHAAQTGEAPRGLTLHDGAVKLVAGKPLSTRAQ
jgi:hypothetical protein